MVAGLAALPALLAYYEAPFRRGKRFGSDLNKWVDGVIGGWTASATGRMQVQLLAIDNARLVGIIRAGGWGRLS